MAENERVKRIFPKFTKLNEFKCAFYFDYLEKVLLTFEKKQEFNTKDYYYFQNKKANVFPKNYMNKWIKLQWIETHHNLNSYFKFIGFYESENDLIDKSKLNGFKNVINDNFYHDKIPKINELFHWDNSIVSFYKIAITGTFGKLENWDKITIEILESLSEKGIEREHIKGHDGIDNNRIEYKPRYNRNKNFRSFKK